MNKHHESLLRRTKIIATLGPATDDPHVLRSIIEAGVNVVRLNFSHGTFSDHQTRVTQVRTIAKELGVTIGILGDLQGPKIRVANFESGSIELKEGDAFTLDASWDSDLGNQERVGIDYKELPGDVSTDDTLLLDDGRISMRVVQVKGDAISCEVINGGTLSNHKGINRLGGGLNAKALTEKDRQDIHYAIELDVDFLAVSFPRNADDLHEARQIMVSHNGNAGIIAKIERAEAIECIDEIIKASDGVMVARGDLAVEIGAAEVPLVRKRIIVQARTLNKPVIVATQMLESMIHEPVPTRAEVSDVANAALENVDAVMLSAETAAGQYPIESVQTMSNVCLRIERQPEAQQSRHRMHTEFGRVDEAIAMAAMYTANHFEVSAIVALTETGSTPLWMSRLRTAIPIYGLTRFARSLGKMTLYRGVYPFYFDVTECTREEMNRKAIAALTEGGILKDSERVVLTKGDHVGVGGGSNAMKIIEVGRVL